MGSTFVAADVKIDEVFGVHICVPYTSIEDIRSDEASFRGRANAIMSITVMKQ